MSVRYMFSPSVFFAYFFTPEYLYKKLSIKMSFSNITQRTRAYADDLQVCVAAQANNIKKFNSINHHIVDIKSISSSKQRGDVIALRFCFLCLFNMFGVYNQFVIQVVKKAFLAQFLPSSKGSHKNNLSYRMMKQNVLSIVSHIISHMRW